MRLKPSAIGCLLMLSLGGCVKVLPEPGPAPKLYTLAPQYKDFRPRAVMPVQLMVERPLANPLLDSPRIILYEQEKGAIGTFSFVRNREWIDRLPSLIHFQLLEALERTHAFKGVGRPDNTLMPDLLLQIDVRDFELIRLPEGAKAKIRLAVKMISAESRHIIASHVFEVQQPAQALQFNSLIQAMDAGWERALSQLTQWAVVQTESHLKAHPPERQ